MPGKLYQVWVPERLVKREGCRVISRRFVDPKAGKDWVEKEKARLTGEKITAKYETEKIDVGERFSFLDAVMLADRNGVIHFEAVGKIMERWPPGYTDEALPGVLVQADAVGGGHCLRVADGGERAADPSS